jgi:hypothetical protein
MYKSLAIIFTILMLSCGPNPQKNSTSQNKSDQNIICGDNCEAKNKNTELTCKLTSADKRKRIETVIASLKKQVIESKELKNGYAYKFKGSDQVIDELTEFIKTERLCCDFFTFGISVSGDASEAWLQITGPEGTRDFITKELAL